MKLARRSLLVAFAVAACAAVIPHAHGAPTTGTPVIDVNGRGWGHGVGLAQWGAKHLADAGADHATILSTFYPGTTLNSVEPREVRVAVYTSPDGTARLTFPDGGEVRSTPSGEQAAGFPVVVAPGGSVMISFDGAAYHVQPLVSGQAAGRPANWSAAGSAVAAESCIPLLGPCPPPGGGDCPLGCTQQPAPPPPTTTPDPTTTPTAPPASSDPNAPPASPDPAGTPVDPAQNPADPTAPASVTPPAESVSAAPVWALAANGGATGVDARIRRYRGLLEATAASGALRLVNQLDVETYLKGMSEVPGTWPIEAIAAQTVAARTYALRAMSFSGELCDYDLCQVYVGADAESPGQVAAVDATVGEVVSYGGALASTVYSADAGGVTASTFEGFGTADGTYPYLTVVRYDTPDPLPWHNEIALTDVASRFGYAGTVSGVTVSQPGPSGRALQVTIEGSAGAVAVDGRTFASRLGLRSTLFTAATGVADGVVAAPPAPINLQTLPEDAAGIKQAATSNSAGNDVTLASTAAPADAAEVARSARDLAGEPALWAMLLVLMLGTMMALSQTEGSRLRFAPLATDAPWWWPDRAPRPGRATAEKRFWGSLSKSDKAAWDNIFAEAMLSPWDEPTPELDPIAKPATRPLVPTPSVSVSPPPPPAPRAAVPPDRVRPPILRARSAAGSRSAHTEPVNAQSSTPANGTSPRVIKLRPRR